MNILPLWPEVPLKKVLTYLDGRVELKDMTEYITITVKRRHGGLEERERLFGHQIKTKKQFRLIPGAFIISRVQCWHQAFALVPDSLPPNMIASTNYDQFAISPEVDRRFFWWFSHSPMFTETVRSSASGVVIEKMVFDREAWLEKTIPLPPLSEQQRIVARIEELAGKIEEARGFRQQMIKGTEALWHASLKSIISKGLMDRWDMKPISEVTEISPSKQDISACSNDMQVSFVPMSALDDLTGRIVKPETRQIGEVKKGYTYFANGDVIFARITPCMQNGKSAIARDLINGIGFGSTEFHVMRPKTNLLAEWLHVIVRHKDFKDDATAHFKGTAGQQRVPQSFLEKKLIPIPPISEQLRIVSYLDNLQSKVDELKRFQNETQKELDALMPSILDKAFKGEI